MAIAAEERSENVQRVKCEGRNGIERANRANSGLATRAQGVGKSDTRGNRRSYKEALVTAGQKNRRRRGDDR
jgi:hypothetical protein